MEQDKHTRANCYNHRFCPAAVWHGLPHFCLGRGLISTQSPMGAAQAEHRRLNSKT